MMKAMSSGEVGPGKPPKKNQFKKGQSGNPLGAKLHSAELKAIKKLTQDEVAMVGQLILDRNLIELMEIKNDKSASVLKVWFAAIAVKAITKGDASALDTILNRIIGKTKETIDANINVTKHKYVVILPSNGRD